MQPWARAWPDGGHHGGSRGIRRPRRRRHSPPTHYGIGTRQADRLRQLADRVSHRWCGTARALNTGTVRRRRWRDRILLSKSTVAITAARPCRTVLEVAHAVGEAGLRPGGGVHPPDRCVVKPGAPASKSGALPQRRGERAGREPRSAAAAVGPLHRIAADGRDVPASMLGDAQQLNPAARRRWSRWTVAATVVTPDCRPGLRRRIVLDCGSDASGSDRPAWHPFTDHADARIAALSEHHVARPSSDDAPAPAGGNTSVRVIPNHVCLTTTSDDKCRGA